MASVADTKLWTTADLLALPDDGIERYIIRGQLREIRDGENVTVRNRFHSAVMACISQRLRNWLETQPLPRGEVMCGEAGCELLTPTDATIIGADVVYYNGEQWAAQSNDRTINIGTPTLLVEILSPSTTIQQLNEKLQTYRAAQCPLVWVVEPYHQHVTVYRLGQPAQLFTVGSTLTAEPYLPGFAVAVERLFG
jgi:Uma2 family endonuclease